MMRLATKDDLTAIDQLILKKAKEFKAAGKTQWKKYLEPDRLDYVTHDITNGHVYVFEDHNEIVGSVSLIPPTSWDEDLWPDAGKAIYLHRLVVDSRQKGKQIGERLITYALSNETTTIRLDCVAENTFLNDYYARFGFTYVGERNGFSLFEKTSLTLT